MNEPTCCRSYVVCRARQLLGAFVMYGQFAALAIVLLVLSKVRTGNCILAGEPRQPAQLGATLLDFFNFTFAGHSLAPYVISEAKTIKLSGRYDA